MHILGYIWLSKIIFQLTRVSVHACVRTILTVHTSSVPTAIYTVWIQRWPGGTLITLQSFELVSCIVPYWKPLNFYYVIKVRGFLYPPLFSFVKSPTNLFCCNNIHISLVIHFDTLFFRYKLDFPINTINETENPFSLQDNKKNYIHSYMDNVTHNILNLTPTLLKLDNDVTLTRFRHNSEMTLTQDTFWHYSDRTLSNLLWPW